MTEPVLRKTSKEVAAEKRKRKAAPPKPPSLPWAKKPPRTVLAPTPAWMRSHYRTGDGDNWHQPQRPNSDHSHLKSIGDKT